MIFNGNEKPTKYSNLAENLQHLSGKCTLMFWSGPHLLILRIPTDALSITLLLSSEVSSLYTCCLTVKAFLTVFFQGLCFAVMSACLLGLGFWLWVLLLFLVFVWLFLFLFLPSSFILISLGSLPPWTQLLISHSEEMLFTINKVLKNIGITFCTNPNTYYNTS